MIIFCGLPKWKVMVQQFLDLQQRFTPVTINPVIELILTCDNCGFIFSRMEESDQCPDCGKHMVRPANEDEQEEFSTRMAELTRSERSEAPRIPEIEDAEISMLSSFAFRLPVTALKINSGMILDVIVEYGENPADRTELAGNVWARQEGGATANFLMSVHLPAKRNEAPRAQVDRIFASLNESGTFRARLADFVSEQL